MRKRSLLSILVVLFWAAGLDAALGAAGAGLEIRAANFLVNPSTGPVTHVLVRNRGAGPLAGRVAVEFPEGWRVEPGERDFSLAGHETGALAFTIKQARDRADNRYPVKVKWSAGGQNGEVTQEVVCASAPFFKPKIDGKLDEWADAIPIALNVNGLKTVLRTYWNTKQFCVAVEVEEARLAPYKEGAPCDAIQFALAPAEGAEAHHEFVVAQSAGLLGRARCYRLLKPGDAASAASERLALKSLAVSEAQAAVRRKGQVTCYEVAIPWSLVPEIKADAGRAFCFSLLVHDPDGTGVRDFGEALNRWPEDRAGNWWRSWDGAKWGAATPFDGRSIFGFCSSIH